MREIESSLAGAFDYLIVIQVAQGICQTFGIERGCGEAALKSFGFLRDGGMPESYEGDPTLQRLYRDQAKWFGQ